MNSQQHDDFGLKGFTLIELLVAIGIIGILIGLSFPAAQASRESARRIQCAQRLGQLIQAAHSFEAANGSLPTSQFIGQQAIRRAPTSIGRFSLHSQLLPFLEQSDLYSGMNFELPTGGLGGLRIFHPTAAAVAVGIFLCPSDPNSRRSDSPAPNSYRACTGFREKVRSPGGFRVQSEGAFTPQIRNHKGSRLSSFSDGLANTLAFSEKPIGSGEGGQYNPFRDWAVVVNVRSERADDWIAACSHLQDPDPSFDAGATWMLPGAIYTHFLASTPPNTPIPDCGQKTFAGLGLFSARSFHPGGVNAAMADGAVKWFASTTTMAVWRSLGTRAGGEVVSD
jgi:prepilin-type N-terminal cleavage/methylation domain-containing protein/prepilin-type processing-associated H-X9-DG protein